MIDHLFERYSALVDHFVVVVAPAAVPAFEQYLRTTPHRAECVVQAEPAGMLPAVLCAQRVIAAQRPDHIWVTWCDQIAISAQTVQRLAEEMERHPDAALVFPTVRQQPPYIHFARNSSSRIVDVLQRREGDNLPPAGESDAGLFALRLDAYLDSLIEYDRLAPAGAASGERNFLPFIPWLAERATVRTFALTDGREAVGINTPDDLRNVETYLLERA
jgi:bifunctional UDP-N-acetylglucosamine pyrophosphorylase/glucosamine-1-phosphate N-acetyltransferase